MFLISPLTLTMICLSGHQTSYSGMYQHLQKAIDHENCGPYPNKKKQDSDVGFEVHFLVPAFNMPNSNSHLCC